MYKTQFEALRNDFAWHHHLRAFLFGLVAALVVVAPFVVMFVNILLLYVRHVYIYLVLIDVFMAMAGVLWVYLYGLTLRTYQKDSLLSPKHLALLFGSILGGIVLIIGLILIIVITPQFI